MRVLNWSTVSVNLCVPKTSSELMRRWNRLSWRSDWAALFRSGRRGLAFQVEVLPEFLLSSPFILGIRDAF